MSVRAIEIGEFAPLTVLRDQAGEKVSFYLPHMTGRPVALFLFRDGRSDAARGTLAALQAALPDFEAVDAGVVAVSSLAVAENARLAGEIGLGFPILSDPKGGFAATFRLAPSADAAQIAVLDRNSRVFARIDGDPGVSQADLALKACAIEAGASDARLVTAQAPVLLIPRIIEPSFCDRLIAYWHEGEKRRNEIVRGRFGDDFVTTDDAVKRRTDVLVPPQDEHPFNVVIRDRLSMRVVPEIDKAFQYETTGYDIARIGCYDGSEQGYFRAHRDELAADTEQPRRFALSLNLNDDFEGGALRFPEYGAQTHRPPIGGGVVFSCKLVHEALPVTAGRRFGLFLFFF